MKKRFLYLAVLCLVCSLLLSACSLPFPLPFLNKDGADIASDTDTTVAVQNTVNMMDLEGVYSEQLAHRGTLRLTAKDSQTAAITIDWPGSATESAHWEMTGTYDPQKQAIVYNDAVMMEQTKSETGAQSNRLVSSSGTGRFTISGKNLAWTDDLAYIGSDPSTFTYSMSLGDDMNQSGSSLVMGTPSVSSTPGSSTAAVPVATATPAPVTQIAATPAPSVAPPPRPDLLPALRLSPKTRRMKRFRSAVPAGLSPITEAPTSPVGTLSVRTARISRSIPKTKTATTSWPNSSRISTSTTVNTIR